MKASILYIAILLFSAVVYSQSPLELAMKGRSNIVAKEPVKIHLGNYKFDTREFYGHLGVLRTEFPKSDTTELKKLITKAMYSEANLTEWTVVEIPNKILVSPKEYIRPRVGLEKIKWTTEAGEESHH